jgi:hypothetical protein
MTLSAVALRNPSRRDLRHVHDGTDSLFQCRMGEMAVASKDSQGTLMG